jgi:hypothetical protein
VRVSDEQLTDEHLASADVQNLPEATPASEQVLPDKAGEPPTDGVSERDAITVIDIIAEIQKRIESGTVLIYASLGGRTYIRTNEPGLVEIDAPCPSARAIEWVMAGVFKWFDFVLKKGDAQTVCMILAGGAVPILPGEKSDLELLQRIEGSPVISTVVEFMASRAENRYSGLAEELWKALTAFIDKRGLYWGGGKPFPGGASILTRRLNADAEILRRCGIKYENSRGSEGAKVVLSRLPDDTDGTSTMPSSVPSGSNLKPGSTLTPAVTPPQAVVAFQARREGRLQFAGNAPASPSPQGDHCS